MNKKVLTLIVVTGMIIISFGVLFNLQSNSLQSQSKPLSITSTSGIISGSNPVGVTSSPNGNYVYVVNYGSNSVSVISTSTNTVTSTISVGSSPHDIATLPNGTYVYVTNSGANSVSVISTSTNTVTSTISVGTNPYGVAITPNGNYVYVVNYGANSVNVISTFLNTVTSTISVGSEPYGIALTPNGEYIYETNYGSNTVSVIATSNNTVVSTITVGTSPTGIAITPNGSYAYVLNYGSGTISIISTSTNTVTSTISDLAYDFTTLTNIAITPNGNYAYITEASTSATYVKVISTSTNTLTTTITVGSVPVGIAITPNGNYVYVANSGSDTISVISTSNNTVVSTISAGSSPYGVSISPNGNYVYVTNYNGASVSVISTSTNTIVSTISVGSSPFGVIVSSYYAYVTNSGSNTVSVISTSTNTVVSTITGFDNPHDIVSIIQNGNPIGYVTNYGSSSVSALSQSSTQYSIQSVVYQTAIIEQGLKTPNWSFNLNGTEISLTLSNYTFLEPNGTYTLNVTSIFHYTYTYPSTITVNGSGQNVYVDFSPVPTYNVTITETGLTIANWKFIFNGTVVSSSSASYTFDKYYNGTYLLYVYNETNYALTYPTSVTVNGANVNVNVVFSAEKIYTITISESGIIGAINYKFTFNGQTYSSTSTSQTFSEPNGTYALNVKNQNGYDVSYQSTITVNGANAQDIITFTKLATYTLNIYQLGLPKNTQYAYIFNNVEYTLTNNSYSYIVNNGTYSLKVLTTNGYNVTYPSTITISGSNVNVYLNYSIIMYKEHFVEQGLPVGTLWSLNINGIQYDSNTTFINLTLPYGSYTVLVTVPNGYTVSNIQPFTTSINGSLHLIYVTSNPNNFFINNLSYFIILVLFLGMFIIIVAVRRHNQ